MSTDIEASSSQPPVRTSSIRAGSVADDGASVPSISKPASSLSTDATATVASKSNANNRPSSQRNSLLTTPSRTSSKNQPPPTSTVDASANAVPDTSSNARKRRKRKDGDGSSVNSGHSTNEGRTHKSHHGGGISKFFSVFLNCCRAPDSAHGVSDDEGPTSRRARKPHSVRGRSTADVPGQKNHSLQDSGIDTESKDVHDERKEGAQVEAGAARAVPIAADNREPAVESEKSVVMGEKVAIKQTAQTNEPGTQDPEATRVEPPMAPVQVGEAIRPSTSSPPPKILPIPQKEDVVMTGAEPTLIDRSLEVKADFHPIPSDREQVLVKPDVEEVQLSDDETHDGVIVESPPSEQKQWLLPPLKPEMLGKKCLVLDLDETLVHSSFKVRIPQWIQSEIVVLLLKVGYSSSSKLISPFQWRLRGHIIMYT